MNGPRIGIIGSGMAGLACARELTNRGYRPVLLDKGRGVGGRLATRRAGDGLRFDHGAQYITAETDGFKAEIDRLICEEAATAWELEDRSVFTGLPSMNALAKGLATGLDIRRETEVVALEECAGSWRVHSNDRAFEFNRLVMTVPAPQAIALLGRSHALSEAISAVRLLPCWCLMAAFSDAPKSGIRVERSRSGPFSWISREAAKPGRQEAAGSQANAYVAHASPEWSQDHLEFERRDVERLLLELLCQQLNVDPASATHVAAHRWRFAKVGAPLGMPFLRNSNATLYLGGDWCLGARVECAWQSGQAIGKALPEPDA
ncbi:MAG: NAD(P)-binding protein [Roseibium sp.]|nr:NAD(P)-binding protein [Roseibium sp.]